MYYRKYFEGNTGENLTESVNRAFGPNTYNHLVYVNQSRIIGNAVAEVLCDAGMDAYYDEDRFLLYPDKKEGFCIALFQSGKTVLRIVLFSSSDIYQSSVSTNSGTSYQPFDANGDTYKFYVTVIGEPKGLLRVCIGTYSSPANTAWGFMVGYGKDKRDGSRVVYTEIGPVSCSTNSFKIRHAGDNSLVDGKTYSATVSFAVSVSGQPNKLVLIDSFSTEGYFTLDNCYIGCGALSSGSEKFYLINGVEYYFPNSYLLIKCLSKVNG